MIQHSYEHGCLVNPSACLASILPNKAMRWKLCRCSPFHELDKHLCLGLLELEGHLYLTILDLGRELGYGRRFCGHFVSSICALTLGANCEVQGTVQDQHKLRSEITLLLNVQYSQLPASRQTVFSKTLGSLTLSFVCSAQHPHCHKPSTIKHIPSTHQIEPTCCKLVMSEEWLPPWSCSALYWQMSSQSSHFCTHLAFGYLKNCHFHCYPWPHTSIVTFNYVNSSVHICSVLLEVCYLYIFM